MVWIVAVICAAACAIIASNKGRNPLGWFFIGFLLGLIGLIIVLVVSNERERERHRVAARSERRRLREKLRQEQMKNEAHRRHAEARLNAHDGSLGIDTRRITPLPAGHGMHDDGPQALPGDSDAAEHQELDEPVVPVKEWKYDTGAGECGPVSAAALRKGLADGKIDGTTLVWRDGMENWRPLSEIQMFRSSFLS